MAGDASFYHKMRDDLKLNEGCIKHMYLDTRGYVTVGVGFMIPNVEEAQGYNFQRRVDGKKATAAEIKQDYELLKQQAVGRRASSYKSVTALDLSDDEIDLVLDQRIDTFESSLTKIFANYVSYPEPAKLGLLDMSFNLGIAGLTTKFPTFVAHAKQKNWQGCAEECQRKGISDERNEATKALFYEAQDLA